MGSLADKILGAQDLKPQPVGAIPEWGIKNGELFMRGMTGRARRAWERCFSRGATGDLLDPDSDPRARAVGNCLVDANGEPVFNEAQVELLALKSAAVLDRLYDQAMLCSGIGDQAQEKAAIKNSEGTSGNASSSD